MPSTFDQRQVRLDSDENIRVIEDQTTWTGIAKRNIKMGTHKDLRYVTQKSELQC